MDNPPEVESTPVVIPCTHLMGPYDLCGRESIDARHAKCKIHITCVSKEFNISKYHPTDCEKCSAFWEFLESCANIEVDSVMKGKIIDSLMGLNNAFNCLSPNFVNLVWGHSLITRWCSII